MAECPHLLDTSMLADGELTGEAADRAREHLASCKDCQAELGHVMQLGAMPAPLPANVVPIAWYRKRSTQLAGVLVAAAAAATIIYVGRPGHGPKGSSEQHATQIALAEQRPIEARLAWDGAKQYRAFSPPRGEAHGKEPISLAAMADLEKAGDLHGVGALAVLAGDYAQAQKYLAGETAAVLGDRAALELQRGDATHALALSDDALAKAPGDPVATWNRALALRDLGLPHAAAEMFRAVATRGEQGWAAEAKQRADALDRELADALAVYLRVAEAGAALAKDGTGLTADDARRVPGMARIELYDAMRAATSPDQLAKLKPIADAIDQADRGTSAATALATAKPDPAVAAAYAELLSGKFARAKVLAALRAAHADDALVVAFVKLGDDNGNVTDGDLPELEKLAAASRDPWIRLIGIEQRGANALAKGDLVLAERTLLASKPLCGAGGPGLRCMKAAMLLGRTYLSWQRLPEAKAALAEAWARVRAIGDWQYAELLLVYLTNLAAVADETIGGGLPLVRAYTEELALQSAHDERAKLTTTSCDQFRWGKERVATVLFNQLRFADAARELASAPPCTVARGAAGAAAGLFIRAELARATNATDAIANVKADLAKLRDQKGVLASVRALVDYIDGALTIGSDAKAGETLLRQAIAEGNAVPDVGDARRAVGLSYEVLATAAAKRGDAKTALAVLGEELGVTPRATCVVGVAVDDRDAIAIVRGSDGTDVIAARERTTPAIDATTAVPAKLVAKLAACADVDVLARPPYHGLARLLPDDLAWRYVTARKQPPAASTATASLVVADVEPPAALALPRLAAWAPAGGTARDTTLLSGPAATPARVLAAIGEARDATIHAHGLADLGDAAYLALSPESDGHYALTAGDVSRAHFASSPVVILAACTAAKAAPLYHARWSLPAAFVAAGARAVIAPTVEVPDQSAAAFFAELRAKLVAGTSAAAALREVRATWLTTHHEEWVRDVVVFE